MILNVIKKEKYRMVLIISIDRKYRLIFDGINRIDRNYWINYCNIDGIHGKYEWILWCMKIIEWK